MKIVCALFITLICLFSCQKSPNIVTIEGEVSGMLNDIILLYGENEVSGFVDTILVKESKFSHKMEIDTFTLATMVFPSLQEYPVYLDKGQKIKIRGNLQNFSFDIQGNKANEDLTAFYIQASQPDSIPLAGINPENKLRNKAEQFIRRNPSSISSIYLLDKYLVGTKDSLDIPKIKDLISVMYGELRDRPEVSEIQKYIEKIERAEIGKIAPAFSIKDMDGTRITRNDFKNKYLLINFWTTWCDSCSKQNAELRKIYDTFIATEKNKKKKEEEDVFAMLGISIDVDKHAWLEAIKRDSLEWKQLRDSCEWEANIISQYSVFTLPYNILIGTDGRIIERNLSNDQLELKLKELTEKEIDRRKKEKERERARKAQSSNSPG